MAQEIILNTIFQVKRATSERWAEVNPILRQGEPGYVIGAEGNNLKIGDGVTAWNDLSFVGVMNVANEDTPGFIKATEDIKINEEGEIFSISTDILSQGDKEIIFNCGGSQE